ncbi:MAG: Lrp/AsnC family transcriptional regulator [Thermoplasmata archaeon]
MKYQLDSTDERILEKLIEDSSKSLAHIARELGLPRPTVNYRIQRMRREGIIRKFTVLKDYSRLGQGMTTFVFVRYQPNPEVSQRRLANELAKFPEILEVHLITGDWDILLKVRTGTLEDVGRLVLDKLRSMKGVERTLTSSSLATVKEEV